MMLMSRLPSVADAHVVDVVAAGESPALPTPVAEPIRTNPRWRPMPQVWWPWLCQLVDVDAANAVVDLVSAERPRSNRSFGPAGTPFTLRLEGADNAGAADWQTLAHWVGAGAAVTVLAGRDRRSAWVCLCRGHERLMLTAVLTDLRVVEAEMAPLAAVPTQVRVLAATVGDTAHVSSRWNGQLDDTRISVRELGGARRISRLSMEVGALIKSCGFVTPEGST
jgi:hypothetical protein